MRTKYYVISNSSKIKILTSPLHDRIGMTKVRESFVHHVALTWLHAHREITWKTNRFWHERISAQAAAVCNILPPSIRVHIQSIFFLFFSFLFLFHFVDKTPTNIPNWVFVKLCGEQHNFKMVHISNPNSGHFKAEILFGLKVCRGWKCLLTVLGAESFSRLKISQDWKFLRAETVSAESVSWLKVYLKSGLQVSRSWKCLKAKVCQQNPVLRHVLRHSWNVLL